MYLRQLPQWRRGIVMAAALTASAVLVASDSRLKPAWPGPAGEQAWAELAAFYAKPGAESPGTRALADLNAPDVGVARQSGEYLAAVFAQAFADESNGRAQWKSTVYWGGHPVSPARELREQLARSFARTAAGPAALPAVRWLLEHERLPAGQQAGVDVLRRIHDPAADALLCQLVAQPHPNSYVLRQAIEEAGRRKLAPADKAFRRLCVHYRQSVREAAALALRQLGSSRRPAYSPAEAFTPALAEDLGAIVAMVYPTVPAKAKWAWFERVDNKDENFYAAPSFGAWILSETPEKIEVLTYFGSHEILTRSEYRTLAESLSATARRLVAARTDPKTPGNGEAGGAALSRGGQLTAQFEAGAITAPEALVSAWLYAAGKHREAADLLFPLLERLPDDRWLREITRDQIGRQIHEELLVAFCYDRDYAKAAAIARHLGSEQFTGYRYRERAEELSDQLPKRADDFRTLVLPTPADWARLHATLDRPAAIRFLAERLRLLSCVQLGQPGGINYGDKQHALRNQSGEEVINPYHELLALRLSPAEIKLLLPYLLDRNYILAYSYWRDFHPDRTLHRVGWVAADIINKASAQPLVDVRSLETMSDAERSARVAELFRWCDAHVALDHAALNLETIKTAHEWAPWNAAVELAIAEKRSAAVAPIVLDRLADFPAHVAEISALVFDLHSPQSLSLASRWTKHENREVRFWAALVLLDQGDADRRDIAIQVLESVLTAHFDINLYAVAIAPLLKVGTPKADDVAVAILRDPQFSSSFFCANVLHRLLLAGKSEAFAYVIAELGSRADGGTCSGEWEGKKVSRALYEFDTVAQWAQTWRTGWTYPITAPESVRLANVEDLKQWMTVQAEAVGHGQKSAVNDQLGAPIKRLNSILDAP